VGEEIAKKTYILSSGAMWTSPRYAYTGKRALCKGKKMLRMKATLKNVKFFSKKLLKTQLFF